MSWRENHLQKIVAEGAADASVGERHQALLRRRHRAPAARRQQLRVYVDLWGGPRQALSCLIEGCRRKEWKNGCGDGKFSCNEGRGWVIVRRGNYSVR